MIARDLNTRIASVAESKTVGIFTLARQLQQQGKDIISLAVGEPDFDTPGAVIQATRQALADQATRYGAVPGLEALRQRLALQFEPFNADNILVTNGAKQALFSIFQVLCNPGDEIILPRPCWVSFTEQIKLAGGVPVLVDTHNQQLDPKAVQSAITQRTRAILINSPNNPTGAVYTPDAMAAVARLAAQNEIFLIADEAYHLFAYDGIDYQPAFSVADDTQRIITVRSFSKHYSMTGFRVGYVAASTSIIRALTTLQGHLCGNVCTFAQHGALAALKMDQGVVQKRLNILQKRRDLAFAYARELFACAQPQGAFYLFPKVTAHLKKNETSETLAMRLLNEAGVAVVPGEAFNGPGHIRISFGADEAVIKEGFERIKHLL